MKPLTMTLIGACCVLMLGASSCTTASVTASPPVLQGPDARLTQPCEEPMVLRDGTKGSVVKVLNHDAAALVRCGRDKKELYQFYLERDFALALGEQGR